ncbi:hypothetical protein [Halomonas sp. NO4]|uniref:hypothetical protein n=1 Tax=Halomonas sp. NO4 TaxID=2484813 RepID=UPI0013D89C1F|nr:hypothetical protein [Halomonas sp. NO4]
MNAERSQLFYTCTFLYVSFQAIQHSMAGKANDSLPCWLDTSLITMLSRELQKSRTEASAFPEVREALDTALYHCGLLLAQCPGALNSQLCRHHLDAIMAPLKDATALLSAPPVKATSHSWQHAARRFLSAWRRP